MIHSDFELTPIQHRPDIPTSSFFQKRDDYVLFRPTTSDTIYSINGKIEYYPKYNVISEYSEWDFKGNPDDYDPKLHSKYLSFRYDFLETNEWLYINSAKKSLIHDIYYNLGSKNIYLALYMPPFSYPQSQSNGMFVTYTFASQLMTLRNKFKSGEVKLKDQKLIDIISAVDENSNGIITIYKLKLD